MGPGVWVEDLHMKVLSLLQENIHLVSIHFTLYVQHQMQLILSFNIFGIGNSSPNTSQATDRGGLMNN